MSFELGIASGDLTSDSAVIWTRVAPGREVGWELEHRDGTARARGTTRASPEGFVHVRLSDLEPGTGWRFRFLDEAAPSPWGHFRTLPERGPVRFAVVSCAKFNSGFFNAYDAVAQRSDLDFVLHLGDYIYEGAQVPRGNQTPGIDIGRSFDPPHDCVTYDDYSRRYAQYRRDPAVQRLHEAHGMVFTLDDHEIADNAWSGGAEEHLDVDGPWDTRLRSALRAWEAWQPTTRTPSSGGVLWQVVPLGDSATLFLCDSRLNRTDPAAADGPAKSVLGAAQVDALEGVVRDSAGRWLVMGMPSKFLSLEAARGDEDADLVLRALKISGRDGAAYHDRWDAYTHERDRVVDLLEGSGARPVILCGDVHFAAFSETASRRMAECVTTSVTSPNLDDKMGWPHGDLSRAYEAKLVERLPELEWCDLDRHGFLVVEVSQEAFSCEWWAVPTVVEPSSDSEPIHRVTLEPGQTGHRREPHGRSR